MQTATDGAGRSVRHRGRPPRACSPPGPTRRRASARTPTPRRTSSAAATATGCWSSSPRTPPTPPSGPACPAGSGWSCSGGEPLRAANTGAPLDAAGVQGLATLRASAKRDETGERRPLRRRLRRGAGGQRRARRPVDDRRRAVQRRRAPAPRSPRCPALAAELARRDGAVPVLRLPVAGRRARRRRASPPRSSCRCGPAPGTTSRPRCAALRGRAAARAARAGGDRGRRRRRPPRTLSRRAGAPAAPGSPTAASATGWQVADAVRGAGRRAARRPAGRGAGPARPGR